MLGARQTRANWDHQTKRVAFQNCRAHLHGPPRGLGEDAARLAQTGSNGRTPAARPRAAGPRTSNGRGLN
eukprot:11180479-Lingulodinium_polyedra.AAC.1